MKVQLPVMDIKDCTSDCSFWESSEEPTATLACNFEWRLRPLEKEFGLPEWCPLRKYEVK